MVSKIKLLMRSLYDENDRFRVMSSFGIYDNMPDDEYIIKLFKAMMKKNLNLKDPQTFNEKLQWLKLYDRKPEYTTMVDKYAVKQYVADKIGEEYIIPTLGVWNHFDEIDFNKLPNQFVLKCTHDSGGLIICKDKSRLDLKAAKKKLERCLKRNFYYSGREWPYKNVKPMIIAEKFMEDNEDVADLGLIDYKFFCFNGIPKFAYVARGAAKAFKSKINMMDLDWKAMPFQRTDHPQFKEIPEKPINFSKMIEFSKVLSKDIPFVRVDFYEINSRLYFGELTFFPGSGYIPFNSEEWDYKLGEWIKLPKIASGLKSKV